MGRHKEWRKIAKKMMRKRKRSAKAIKRDEEMRKEEEKRAQSPSYQRWLEEQKQLEKFQQEEEEKIRQEQHNRWLREEELAKERWHKQQKRLERLKAEKTKQELIIREEWDREQEKLKEEAEAKEREKEERERQEAELQDRIEKYVTGELERLPSSARTVNETQPGCSECPFFSKVSACRFRDSCSRNHIRPSVSRALLFPGFYTHFRMDQMSQSNEYDTDVGLEFDDKEIYEDFAEFYHDVLTELKTYGTVTQFKVCCNEEPHLRGNVYVEYKSERNAIRAFRALHGRYYGGKRISAEFCNIPSWGRALCGLFSRKRCPKGNKCNFLHVFKNPSSEFRNADRDICNDRSPDRIIEEKVDWNWSPSPEPVQRSSREWRSETKENTNDGHSERRHRKESHRSVSGSREKRNSHSGRKRLKDKTRSPEHRTLKHNRKKRKRSRSRSSLRSTHSRK